MMREDSTKQSKSNILRPWLEYETFNENKRPACRI